MSFTMDAKAKSFRDDEIEDWPTPAPITSEINKPASGISSRPCPPTPS